MSETRCREFFPGDTDFSQIGVPTWTMAWWLDIKVSNLDNVGVGVLICTHWLVQYQASYLL